MRVSAILALATFNYFCFLAPLILLVGIRIVALYFKVELQYTSRLKLLKRQKGQWGTFLIEFCMTFMGGPPER